MCEYIVVTWLMYAYVTAINVLCYTQAFFFFLKKYIWSVWDQNKYTTWLNFPFPLTRVALFHISFVESGQVCFEFTVNNPPQLNYGHVLSLSDRQQETATLSSLFS